MQAHELSRALDQKELDIHYQPQWSTASNSLAGIEALIRWPAQAPMSPEDFLPLFEAAGLSTRLALYTLNRVCDDIARLLAHRIEFAYIGVNYSYNQLVASNALEFLQATVHEKGVAPGRLMIELTESQSFGNLARLIQKLEPLAEAGFNFALDDFCTGYSTVHHMCELPVDVIKIDKSFVSRLHEFKAKVVVEQLITMANKMDMKAIAEGVETHRQVKALNAMGCDIMQGYYYAKPMDFDSLLDFCQSRDSARPLLRAVV